MTARRNYGAEITISELHELLICDPFVGKLFWNIGKRKGKEAGTEDKGYLKISLYGKRYFAHHIMWAMVMGGWAKDEIDHINRDRRDNRFVNLRDASRSQNAWNSKLFKNNTSGYKGIYDTVYGWRVLIMAHRKTFDFGTFRNLREAVIVRAAAASELHGEFARRPGQKEL